MLIKKWYFTKGCKSIVNILNNLFQYYYKMSQYQSLNIKLADLQLNESKSGTKNTTDVTLRLSSNMIGTNEANFPHKLLLNNRQVATLGKAFRKT